MGVQIGDRPTLSKGSPYNTQTGDEFESEYGVFTVISKRTDFSRESQLFRQLYRLGTSCSRHLFSYYSIMQHIEQNISIIIPTLNEGERIGRLLNWLGRHFPSSERIVVDGGSRDNTVEIASESAFCLSCSRGRGIQQNLGAEKASGKVLWFVHADCLPHPESVLAMTEALADPDIVGGAFEYSFSETSRLFRFLAAYSNAKNRLKNCIYGDMGIFVRTEVFDRMGGFGKPHLMEDMELCSRLKKEGKIVILSPRMITSARAWHAEGTIRKILKESIIKNAFHLKVSDQRLYRWYYGADNEIHS
jgi:rSAM/selenodomain-associated transferase 2